MAQVKIKIKKVREGEWIPKQMTEEAVGFDVCAAEDVAIFNVRASDTADLIPLGFAMEIPRGYHAKLFLRSSIGKNTKLRLANGTGIIDSDYRGEVMLLVENLSRERIRIAKGTRIAQMIIEKNVDVHFEEATELTATKRGKGGLGSTGGK